MMDECLRYFVLAMMMVALTVLLQLIIIIIIKQYHYHRDMYHSHNHLFRALQLNLVYYENRRRTRTQLIRYII